MTTTRRHWRIASATAVVALALVSAPIGAANAADTTTGGVTWTVGDTADGLTIDAVRQTTLDFLGSGIDVDGWATEPALGLVTNVAQFPSLGAIGFGPASTTVVDGTTTITRVNSSSGITAVLELRGPLARWTFSWSSSIPLTFITMAVRSGLTDDLEVIPNPADATDNGTFVVSDSSGTRAPVAVQGSPDGWALFVVTPGSDILLIRNNALGLTLPPGSVSFTARVAASAPCSGESDAAWLATQARGLAASFDSAPVDQPIVPCGTGVASTESGTPVNALVPIAFDDAVVAAGYLDAPDELRVVPGDLPTGYTATLDVSSGAPKVRIAGPALAPGATLDARIGFYLEREVGGDTVRESPVAVDITVTGAAVLAATGTTDATPGAIGALAAILAGVGVLISRRRSLRV